MGEGEASAPYVTCSQCARLRARKEFEPGQLRSNDPLCRSCWVEQNRAGAETKESSNEQPVGLLIILGPVAIGFGIAICGGVFWFGLLFVIPGLLYRYSGPFKWTFDAIRSFLHGIFFGPEGTKDEDEGCLSIVGNLGGCLSGLAYFVVPIVLLVHYIKFRTDPRFERIRNYNNAVQKWQGGLAEEYESTWTSRQLPTLYLEQGFNDANQVQPVTYEPTFQLETSKTVEPSLPQLQPNANDMRTYEDKVMVAAMVENFHTPSIYPSESGEALTVRIGEQNFTFATVHQWKEDSSYSTCHYAAYLNGLMFVFNEEVQKHACTPLYHNPHLKCHDKWPSLYPPADLALRVEIRSPHDPVIIACDLLGCPTTYLYGSWWGESMGDQWNVITILAYVVVCSAIVLFLFSKPGWLGEMLEWDKKVEPKEEPKAAETGWWARRNADIKADVEAGDPHVPPSRQHIGETQTTNP